MLLNQMRCYYGVKQFVHEVLISKVKEDVSELRLFINNIELHNQLHATYILNCCRLEWQNLQVVYKFIEHVILENCALLAHLTLTARRLILVSTENCVRL